MSDTMIDSNQRDSIVTIRLYCGYYTYGVFVLTLCFCRNVSKYVCKNILRKSKEELYA